MKDIIIVNEPMDLRTKNNTQYNEWQFNFRKNNELPEKSFVAFGTVTEAFWWNRPLVEDAKEFITQEEDGLMAMNLPYWGLKNNPKTNLFKTNYNFVIPKNSVMVATFIKWKDWDEERKNKVRNFLKTICKDVLVDLGVPADALDYTTTDLIYSGRKFGGVEAIDCEEAYSHNICITCMALPEKDIFDRLKGKYAHHTPITGISEESNVTREAILDEMYKRFTEFFGTI